MVVGLSGEGEVLIDDVVYTLRAGERLLVPPFSSHSYGRVADKAPLECLFVGFELDAKSHLLELARVVKTCSSNDWQCLQNLISHYLLCMDWSGDGHGSRQALNTEVVIHLARWLEQLLIGHEPSSVAARSVRTSQAQQIVERVWIFAREASPNPLIHHNGEKELPPGEPAAGLTRRALAKRLGVSESSLRDAINTFAHVSPREFVRRVRLQRAAMWLMEYGFPVQIVARNAGYSDPAALSTEFKKARPSDLLRRYHAHVSKAYRGVLAERGSIRRLELNYPLRYEFACLW